MKPPEVEGSDTKITFQFNNPGCEWNGTIYLIDRATPYKMVFYIWELEAYNDPNNKRIEQYLFDVLGYQVEISEWHDGNGHGEAKLKRVL